MTIDKFEKGYYFLSNFYPCKVLYEGLEYNSSECAYQAAKTEDNDIKVKFTTLNSSEAKKLGRQIQLRPHWDSIKVDIMYDILIQKFIQNKELQKLLIDTGDAELIEGNTWGDDFWGVCNGKGRNVLGNLLMSIRDRYKYLYKFVDFVDRAIADDMKYASKEDIPTLIHIECCPSIIMEVYFCLYAKAWDNCQSLDITSNKFNVKYHIASNNFFDIGNIAIYTDDNSPIDIKKVFSFAF